MNRSAVKTAAKLGRHDRILRWNLPHNVLGGHLRHAATSCDQMPEVKQWAYLDVNQAGR